MDLNLDSIILLVGSPGSGKSFLIKDLMRHMWRSFHYGLVICPTAYDPGYDWMYQPWVHTVYDEKPIKELIRLQQTTKKSKAFLILDDCLGSIDFQSAFWTQIFTTTRHLRLTIIVATQYPAKIPTMVRDCANYVFIFRQHTSRAFALLYEGYGQGGQFTNQRAFTDWLNRKTAVPYTCVLYNRDGQGENAFTTYRAQKVEPDRFRIKPRGS